MRRSPVSFLLLGAVAALALLLGPRPGQAQQAGKKITFTTADGVEIAGTFYGGDKGNATVMLLHAIGKGEDSHKAGWDNLAKALQKEGYSVLTFDFRGHGGSTTVEPHKFWRYRENAAGVKANKAALDTISVDQFNPAYYPALVNDITAAKCYLDLRNDAGDCNTSAVVVVGADTGATLGAIWMNSECHCYRVLEPEPQVPFPHVGEAPEGKALAAGIFLSISPTLGKRKINLGRVLFAPGQQLAVPMVFAYGDGDKKGKTEAKALEKILKTNRLRKQEYTGGYEVAGGGDATGRDLLRGGLKTEADIINYLRGVLAKQPPWINRDFQKSMYIWTLGRPGPLGQIPRPFIQAKGARQQDPVFAFSNYEMFIPR